MDPDRYSDPRLQAVVCLSWLLIRQVLSQWMSLAHVLIATMTAMSSLRMKTFPFLLLLCFLSDASCLAVNPQGISKVISTKRDGGMSQTYSLLKAEGNSSKPSSELSFTKQLQAGLRSTFLPSGYPTKTPPGYLSYASWSWIQDLSTQLRAVMATQRVLEGVGVGREGATALSALMNFIVRDGCGMGATLLFTSVASSRFSSDIKRWRLFADVMVDIGITLEVCATLVPTELFLPMICVGNMCKAICGVAAGACGGAINLHWAKGSDISDIQAKFGAQHTVTGSLGLVFAALFARTVSKLKPTPLWILYSSLTVLHIVANRACMKLIAFDSLNTVRMNMILSEFLSWWNTRELDEKSMTSPAVLARKEPLFFLPGQNLVVAKIPIVFGASFNEIVAKCQCDVPTIAAQLSNSGYLVVPGKSKGVKPCILVAVQEDTSPSDQAKAYLHATLLSQHMRQSTDGVAMETNALSELNAAWPFFQALCKSSGWDLTKTELRSQGYEISCIA